MWLSPNSAFREKTGPIVASDLARAGGRSGSPKCAKATARMRAFATLKKTPGRDGRLDFGTMTARSFILYQSQLYREDRSTQSCNDSRSGRLNRKISGGHDPYSSLAAVSYLLGSIPSLSAGAVFKGEDCARRRQRHIGARRGAQVTALELRLVASMRQGLLRSGARGLSADRIHS